MIRNAVIHIVNEQPLLADLFDTPTPADAGLICTNLRTLAGKRPVFVDHVESVFFFPYGHIRFVEIPPGADGGPGLTATREPALPEPEPDPEPELEIDEDFLRRIRDV